MSDSEQTSTKTVPGYEVTETEPAVGQEVLWTRSSGKLWNHVTREPRGWRTKAGGYVPIEPGMRWTYLPGDSPLERVISSGRLCNMGPTNGERDFKVVVMVGHGSDSRPTMFIGSDEQAAAAAALGALAGEAPDPESARRLWNRAHSPRGVSAVEEILSQAVKHLQVWLDLDECECEMGEHRCGRDEVEQTVSAALAALDPVP